MQSQPAAGIAGQPLAPLAAPRALSVALVATCPPRQCGIATFTCDLARALKQAEPTTRICWAAINEDDSSHLYKPEVRWRICQGDPDSYRQAAKQLNASSVDVVSVQHEFGLYGRWSDEFEDHLTPFMETLRKPLVTTLHTVLPDPSPSVREAVQRIGQHSQAVIVMANLAMRLLVDQYGLSETKLHVIPHGVPPVEPRGRRRTKARFGWQGRTILSTFGLLDPRKGLEYMIEAMATVSQDYPDALYVIVGKTHPELVRRAGETYRRELNDLVRAYGLRNHVAFVNDYLTQSQIVEYLLASDVYITPYLDPKQITSGTLAYALGAAKAIISTPYLHATEVLADGRGILVPFRDADALAASALRILGDPVYKQQLEQAAYSYGRDTGWPSIGKRMLDIFRSVAQTSSFTDQASQRLRAGILDQPPVTLAPSDRTRAVTPVLTRVEPVDAYAEGARAVG